LRLPTHCVIITCGGQRREEILTRPPGRQAEIGRIRGKGTVKRSSVIVVLLVMLPMLACNFSFSAGDDEVVGGGEPGLRTAVTCRGLGDDYSPIGPTDVFAPEDESLYEVSLPLDASNAGEGYAGFSLTNTEPWPVGNYHIDIYLDDEFDRTVEFRVE